MEKKTVGCDTHGFSCQTSSLGVGFAAAGGVFALRSKRRAQHTKRDQRRHRNFNNCKHIIPNGAGILPLCSLSEATKALCSARRNRTTTRALQIVGAP